MTEKKLFNRKAAFAVMVIASMQMTFPVLAENPDNLYRKGKYEEAEKEYKKLEIDNPRDTRYRYNRGCAALQKGDYENAATAFSSVLRRAEDNEQRFRAAYNLGNTAFAQGDYASAAEFYKQAALLKPGSSEARYNLELSVRKKREAEEKQKNGESEDGKNNSNDGKKDDKPQKQNEKNEKDSKKNKEKNEGNNSGTEDKNRQENLSGDLSAGEMPEKKQDNTKAAAVEINKAKALLDNIRENQSKAMQYRIKDKESSTGSVKDW